MHFTIKQYKPKVSPAQISPENHQDIENVSFVTLPFTFDEVWTIGETTWAINEVKIVFFKDEVFVTVVVKTDLNPGKLSRKQAKRITKPIAQYTLHQGYLERARTLTIDGKNYPLDEDIFVTLVNREAGVIPGVGQVPIQRVAFELKDLVALSK